MTSVTASLAIVYWRQTATQHQQSALRQFVWPASPRTHYALSVPMSVYFLSFMRLACCWRRRCNKSPPSELRALQSATVPSQSLVPIPTPCQPQSTTHNPPFTPPHAGGVGRNRDSEPISGFITCCQRCDRLGVINTVPPDRGKLWHRW